MIPIHHEYPGQLGGYYDWSWFVKNKGDVLMGGKLDSKECAVMFKAMADPTRLAILRILVGGNKSVTELVEFLGASQPAVSHHLEILKRVGLVYKERKGKLMMNRINPKIVSKVTKDSETIEFGCCAVAIRSGGPVKGKRFISEEI